jgi:hypothetical protein
MLSIPKTNFETSNRFVNYKKNKVDSLDINTTREIFNYIEGNIGSNTINENLQIIIVK